MQLAYGEHAPIPLLADIPAWLAEAAYDEHDRRMFGCPALTALAA